MATHEIDADGALRFFTYSDSRKVRDIASSAQVSLGYADPRQQHVGQRRGHRAAGQGSRA